MLEIIIHIYSIMFALTILAIFVICIGLKKPIKGIDNVWQAFWYCILWFIPAIIELYKFIKNLFK